MTLSDDEMESFSVELRVRLVELAREAVWRLEASHDPGDIAAADQANAGLRDGEIKIDVFELDGEAWIDVEVAGLLLCSCPARDIVLGLSESAPD